MDYKQSVNTNSATWNIVMNNVGEGCSLEMAKQQGRQSESLTLGGCHILMGEKLTFISILCKFPLLLFICFVGLLPLTSILHNKQQYFC